MKKSIVFLTALLIIALTTTTAFAQKYGSIGSLGYNGKFSVSETAGVGNSSTHRFIGEVFVNKANNLGVAFSHGFDNQLLAGGVFSERNRTSLGVIYRFPIGKYSEIKFGALRYFGNTRNMDLEGHSTSGGEEIRGFGIPISLILTHDDGKFFPKTYISVEQDFSTVYRFQRRREPLNLCFDLSIYCQEMGENFYISPLVGYELSNGTSAVNIGGVLSSSISRKDAIKLRYFKDLNTGAGGFLVSINFIGLFVPQIGGCL